MLFLWLNVEKKSVLSIKLLSSMSHKLLFVFAVSVFQLIHPISWKRIRGAGWRHRSESLSVSLSSPSMCVCVWHQTQPLFPAATEDLISIWLCLLSVQPCHGSEADQTGCKETNDSLLFRWPFSLSHLSVLLLFFWRILKPDFTPCPVLPWCRLCQSLIASGMSFILLQLGVQSLRSCTKFVIQLDCVLCVLKANVILQLGKELMDGACACVCAHACLWL